MSVNPPQMFSFGAVMTVALLSKHVGTAELTGIDDAVSLIHRLEFFRRFFFPLVLTQADFGSGLGLASTSAASDKRRRAECAN